MQNNIDNYRLELSIKAKNGIDFILSAAITWLLISAIWNLNISSYNKSVLTFIIGSALLPLALTFSKLFKTNWKVKDNPLQPLGLWFNFAQLFYFTFLILILIKSPDYFILTYAIITGAHFFPYSWLYKTNLYALFAGLISLGALLLGVSLNVQNMYLLPLSVSATLFVLAILIFFDYRKKASQIS